jgi:hypothetical protein
MNADPATAGRIQFNANDLEPQRCRVAGIIFIGNLKHYLTEILLPLAQSINSRSGWNGPDIGSMIRRMRHSLS